jgi:hypothetical protein
VVLNHSEVLLGLTTASKLGRADSAELAGSEPLAPLEGVFFEPLMQLPLIFADRDISTPEVAISLTQTLRVIPDS